MKPPDHQKHERVYQARQSNTKLKNCVYCNKGDHRTTNCNSVTNVNERRKILSDKKFISIALEQIIKLLNANVKIHVEHANANIMHQFVRKLKMLSSTQMRETHPLHIQYLSLQLKSDSHLPKKFLFICVNESPLKMMKNAFYFILKTLFVLKIFKFLS